MQAEMLPGLSRIGRLVDSIAHGKIGTMQAFSTARIHNVGVGRRNCNGANRLRRLMIENRIPGAAVVVALPNSAVHLSNIENIRFTWNSSGRARAPSAKRPNHSPVEFLECVVGKRDLSARMQRGQSKGKWNE